MLIFFFFHRIIGLFEKKFSILLISISKRISISRNIKIKFLKKEKKKDEKKELFKNKYIILNSFFLFFYLNKFSNLISLIYFNS